jgi:D-glucuronyl C5-epimerase C-terminus/Putative peptidoglycan binding domain
VSAPTSRPLFWDEEFAWDARVRAEPDAIPALAHPPPARPVRRRRRLSAAFLRRLGVAATVLVTLALAVVTGAVIAPEPVTETPREQPAAAPPARSAAPSEIELMQLGDRGEPVRGVQVALAVIRSETGTADGFFEARTRDAVVAFQEEHGLEADGVVGPATAEALRDALAEEATRAAGQARKGLRSAVVAGRLGPETAPRYDEVVTRSLERLSELPLAQAAYLALVLEQVAEHSDLYDGPRALALFGMVEANAQHLGGNALPNHARDITATDGVVYRLVPTRGLQFHPLANFAALNRHVTRGRSDEARALAKALAARGVPDGDALVWEYYFPFGGPSPWRSGFAQAVAAEALARAADLSGDQSLFVAAKAAFRAIPEGLAVATAGGTWILEYAFSDMLVLNAQLQSLVSLRRYVDTTGDLEARALAGELETASRALLPRFDAGCWSLYSLGGGTASPHYHRYHVALLERLAGTTGEAPWGDVARRWSGACR